MDRAEESRNDEGKQRVADDAHRLEERSRNLLAVSSLGGPICSVHIHLPA